MSDAVVKDPLACEEHELTVEDLRQELQKCRPNGWAGTDWIDKVRFCVWPGQNSDGKKYDIEGKEASYSASRQRCRAGGESKPPTGPVGSGLKKMTAATWYGSAEEVARVLSSSVEELQDELEFLSSPTFPEFADSKVAAREAVRAELARRAS